jgi:hypothetical protein
MDSSELGSLGKEVHANLTVEELESRFEMTFLHLDFAKCCKHGGCLAACCDGGGHCLVHQSSSADGDLIE